MATKDLPLYKCSKKTCRAEYLVVPFAMNSVAKKCPYCGSPNAMPMLSMTMMVSVEGDNVLKTEVVIERRRALMVENGQS